MRSKLTASGAAVAGVLILAASPAFAQDTRMGPAAQQGQVPEALQTQQMSSPQSSMSNPASTQPASDVASPKTTLASATVQDSSGQSVGQVQSVKTTASGKTSSVAVSLTSASGAAKVVSIRASKLRFDPSGNTLKASLTSSEINALPATESP
jgi:hypothetical protein